MKVAGTMYYHKEYLVQTSASCLKSYFTTVHINTTYPEIPFITNTHHECQLPLRKNLCEKDFFLY